MDPTAHRCLVWGDDLWLPSKLALIDLAGTRAILWWDLSYLHEALVGPELRERKDWVRWVKKLLMQSGVGNSNYKVSGPGATPPHFVKNVVPTGALLHLLCMLLDSTTKIPDLLVRYLQHLVCLAIAAIPA